MLKPVLEAEAGTKLRIGEVGYAVPRCGFGHYLATCIGGSTSREECYAVGGVLDWHWKWRALYEMCIR